MPYKTMVQLVGLRERLVSEAQSTRELDVNAHSERTKSDASRHSWRTSLELFNLSNEPVTKKTNIAPIPVEEPIIKGLCTNYRRPQQLLVHCGSERVKGECSGTAKYGYPISRPLVLRGHHSKAARQKEHLTRLSGSSITSATFQETLNRARRKVGSAKLKPLHQPPMRLGKPQMKNAVQSGSNRAVSYDASKHGRMTLNSGTSRRRPVTAPHRPSTAATTVEMMMSMPFSLSDEQKKLIKNPPMRHGTADVKDNFKPLTTTGLFDDSRSKRDSTWHRLADPLERPCPKMPLRFDLECGAACTNNKKIYMSPPPKPKVIPAGNSLGPKMAKKYDTAKRYSHMKINTFVPPSPKVSTKMPAAA